MNKNIVKGLVNNLLKQAMVETQSDELSLACLRVFLSIPEGDQGIAQTQIVKAMADVSDTTVSRHIAFLAGLSLRRKVPLPEPLLETVPDPLDRRYRYIKLTPAGAALQDKLLSEFLKRILTK